jgi:DNA polymerase III epsilon subunit-like protein
MYLFFDTETTGLPRSYNAPLSDLGNWPRVVQLAWLLTDDAGKEQEKGEFIVRPEGFTIPSQAAAVHGITTEIALQKGIPIGHAVAAFHLSLKSARMLVAHNFEFDQRILAAEYLRLGQPHELLMQTESTCTMRRSTDFCRLPSERGGYKWPKLIELHTRLFGSAFESAHDAMADVQACARCFFELRRQGVFGERASAAEPGPL